MAIFLFIILMFSTAVFAKDTLIYRSGNLDGFGAYSSRYYERHWKRMCKTPARYDAMREAAEMGKRNPCASK